MWSPDSQVKYSQLRICQSTSPWPGLRSIDPQAAHVPVALGRNDVADRAVVDALHGLDVDGLVAALRARDNGQLLLRGLLGGLDHHLVPGGTHADGFFHEDVLAGLDRRGQMNRPESRRRRQDDQVHIRQGQDLLVGIEADEAAVVGDTELFLEALEPVAESVGQGDDLHAGRRLDAVLRRARPSSAAADDADADRVTAGREGQRSGRPRHHQGPGRHCRTPQEFSSCPFSSFDHSSALQ